MNRFLILSALLCLAIAAHAQKPLLINGMKPKTFGSPAETELFHRTLSMSLSTNQGEITITRADEKSIDHWKVSGTSINGDIRTVNTGNFKSWEFVSGKDTVRMGSKCPNGNDWYGLIGWTVTQGNTTIHIAGNEPDCMSQYYWMIAPDTASCDLVSTPPNKNTYVNYSGSDICTGGQWHVKQKNKIPTTVSDKARLAAAFITFASLTIREEERSAD